MPAAEASTVTMCVDGRLCRTGINTYITPEDAAIIRQGDEAVVHDAASGEGATRSLAALVFFPLTEH